MRRSDVEFTQEVFSRSENRIKKRNTIKKALIGTVPLILCMVLIAVWQDNTIEPSLPSVGNMLAKVEWGDKTYIYTEDQAKEIVVFLDKTMVNDDAFSGAEEEGGFDMSNGNLTGENVGSTEIEVEESDKFQITITITEETNVERIYVLYENGEVFEGNRKKGTLEESVLVELLEFLQIGGGQ